MYELLRVIGANYKLSDFEFASKVKYFKKLHEKCKECVHVEIFLKKLIFQTHMTKTISKIGQMGIFKLLHKSAIRQSNQGNFSLNQITEESKFSLDDSKSNDNLVNQSQIN
jgi:hypothetical protein